ncbi:class II fructose-bisphosphate aldolase [Mycolicibacterium goodii]|uniref:Class II fructose-bisphosphate aldolase n=1 Tax=Mycolicibacterium goodii TaxID=134601 RepID=A0ABS6I176_MYCGD|nr:class II fructose-bisphosphate aldolase [Mycolicibacterium goodii]MBU8827694.1 class II fructose-bisphosphate aldolase [Mycolicibacterium goodii]MBU8841485.1 class II fructose-bisphosphate aldolase [Mycolicibacterium goodii]
MPVVPLMDILTPALENRYGVPAINIVNIETMGAVLNAAVAERSPVIIQTSVKTVRHVGSAVLAASWRAMTAGIEVPVSLHLDHCPSRAVITECLEAGWNSVLFDASELPVAENLAQTVEVVAEARRHGAHVEGEIESITGVEDGIGSDEPAERQTLDICLDFIERTTVDVFAPAIGNAHGSYKAAPVLDYQRVQDVVDKTGVPVALHGGTGLSEQQFTDLIARGCAKVNISTALKLSWMHSSLAALRYAESRDKWEPLDLIKASSDSVGQMVAEHMRIFGSAGRAA